MFHESRGENISPLNIQDNSREKRREKVSRFQFFFLFLFFISKPWRRAEEGIFFPRGFRVTATLQMEIVERINATRRTKQFLQTIFLLKLRAWQFEGEGRRCFFWKREIVRGNESVLACREWPWLHFHALSRPDRFTARCVSKQFNKIRS